MFCRALLYAGIAATATILLLVILGAPFVLACALAGMIVGSVAVYPWARDINRVVGRAWRRITGPPAGR